MPRNERKVQFRVKRLETTHWIVYQSNPIRQRDYGIRASDGVWTDWGVARPNAWIKQSRK